MTFATTRVVEWVSLVLLAGLVLFGLYAGGVL